MLAASCADPDADSAAEERIADLREAGRAKTAEAGPPDAADRAAEPAPAPEELVAAAFDRARAGIRDPNPEVAVEAVRAVGRLRTDRTIDVLLDIATADARPALRFEATTLLARLDDPRVRPALRRILRDDADAHVRAAAALGLAKVGTVADALVLVEAAEEAFRRGDLETESAAVGAVERLMGYGVRYEATDAAEAREAAIDRLRYWAERRTVPRARGPGDAPPPAE
jgi:HEAT repeat protein